MWIQVPAAIRTPSFLLVGCDSIGESELLHPCMLLSLGRSGMLPYSSTEPIYIYIIYTLCAELRLHGSAWKRRIFRVLIYTRVPKLYYIFGDPHIDRNLAYKTYFTSA